MERRIALFGLCTSRRLVEMESFGVGFGASECLATALKEGLIEAAVTMCDGAGTIIRGTIGCPGEWYGNECTH